MTEDEGILARARKVRDNATQNFINPSAWLADSAQRLLKTAEEFKEAEAAQEKDFVKISNAIRGSRITAEQSRRLQVLLAQATR